MAEDDGRIVGTLTLAAFEIPTGRRAWIEDVVTDAAARGKGVASALVNAALAHAAALGARTVDLTSRPDRADANRLYVAARLRAAHHERVPPPRPLERPTVPAPVASYSSGGKAAGNRRIRVGNIGVKRPSPHGRSGSLAKAWLSTPTMSVETR